MNKPTKVIKQVYKGHPTISVWEVDETGNPVGKYPLVSLGVKKASALLQHAQEIEEFVVAEDKNNG